MSEIKINWWQRTDRMWVGDLEGTPFWLHVDQQMVGSTPGSWLLSLSLDPDRAGMVWSGNDPNGPRFDTPEMAKEHAPTLLRSLAAFATKVADEIEQQTPIGRLRADLRRAERDLDSAGDRRDGNACDAAEARIQEIEGELRALTGQRPS